jgi:hypothetical protein
MMDDRSAVKAMRRLRLCLSLVALRYRRQLLRMPDRERVRSLRLVS